MSGKKGDLYRITKPIIYNKRRYFPGQSVFMTGKNAEIFYPAGCVDTQDRRDDKNRLKHALDKRSH